MVSYVSVCVFWVGKLLDSSFTCWCCLWRQKRTFFFKSVALSEVAQVLACSSDSVACRRRVASVGRVVVTEENRSIGNEAYTEYVDPFIVCFMLSFILLAPLIHNLILSNGKVNTEFWTFYERLCEKNLYVFRISVTTNSFRTLYGQTPIYAAVTFRKVRRKSNFAPTEIWVYVWSTIHVYTRDSNWNPNSNSLQPARCRMTTPLSRSVLSPSSIFPSTFVSLCFYPHKEKLGPVSKVLLFNFFLHFWNCVNWNFVCRWVAV